MKFMRTAKKIFNKFYWVAILCLLIPSFNRLIHKGFFPTQDFIYVARIYEMDKAIKDGQFPVRWAPDLRYGEPLFNFYAPLPYYIGSVIHTFKINFLDTAKVLYALGFVFSFFAMYLLGKEIWGKTGGLISAFIYLYAPYRALDVYVRGDLSESWVFIFFPLIFLGALKLSKSVNGKNIALLAFSLAGLFYTHNVMTMLMIPFFGIFILFIYWRDKEFKKIWPIIYSSLLGVGIGASFLLPAFFEKGYIQTQHLTGGYFDFRAHFVETRQFFSTFWGYGASTWLGEDGMSFQLGIIQWIMLGLVLAISVINIKNFKKDKSLHLAGVFIGLFLFSLFLQHNKSTFIWLKIPLLQFVQFPWRFMAFSTFFAALIVGYLGKIAEKRRYLSLGILVILLIIVNYNYFRPESYYNDSIDAHYTAQVFQTDDKMPKDYLPIWVKLRKEEKILTPLITSGIAEITSYVSNSDSASFTLDVQKESTVEVPITYFPGWRVKLNNKNIKPNDPGELGLINFTAQTGTYNVAVNFNNTPLRTIGNILSLVSAVIVVYFILKDKIIEKKK